MKLYLYKTVISCLITATFFTCFPASYNDTPLPALPLTNYRPENTNRIMQYYYLANKHYVRSLEDITVSSGIRFDQFEQQQLPFFIMQLIENADGKDYRQCFKKMLIEEVFKKILLYCSLARNFRSQNQQLSTFFEQNPLLLQRLKIHVCAIDKILDAPRIEYDELIYHCREKVRICRSISDLLLRSYQG